MGWTSNLIVGVAEYLDAGAAGSWYPTGAFPANPPRPVITVESLPDAHDRAMALRAYPLEDNAGLNDVLVGLQVRSRATSPTGVNDIADAVFDLLHGARGLVLGTAPNQVHTVLIWRQSSAVLGVDPTQRRWERSDNFYVRASRPTAWRPD